MKIYTKGGDGGETSLFGGERVAKHDARVRAYGDVDETNSVIGVAIAHLGKEGALAKLRPALQEVQNRLFDLGAELASAGPDQVAKLARKIEKADIEVLEKQIDEWQKGLTPLKNFILPGGSAASAHLHHARTVCRRAERSISEFTSSGKSRDELLRYMNRLSDWLFVLARHANHLSGVTEPEWSQ